MFKTHYKDETKTENSMTLLVLKRMRDETQKVVLWHERVLIEQNSNANFFSHMKQVRWAYVKIQQLKNWNVDSRAQRRIGCLALPIY